MLKRLFTLFFFLIFTFNTNAEIQKIVYIDIEKIMQQSVAGKNFINLLKVFYLYRFGLFYPHF